MNRITTILVLALALLSCKQPTLGQEVSDKFIARLHTSDLETEYYKRLGSTTEEKFLALFEEIDWQKEFEHSIETQYYHATDLEVFNTEAGKYLVVMVFAGVKKEPFQFVMGYGSHRETGDPDAPDRKVNLYATRSMSRETPEKLIKLFFEEDFIMLEKEFDKLYFMIELEDTYKHVE